MFVKFESKYNLFIDENASEWMAISRQISTHFTLCIVYTDGIGNDAIDEK